jgi:DNA-binding transcriptional regulator YiaG
MRLPTYEKIMRRCDAYEATAIRQHLTFLSHLQKYSWPESFDWLDGQSPASSIREREVKMPPSHIQLISGSQLRAARALAGLTQDDVARAGSWHVQSVAYWESKGTGVPTSHWPHLERLAAILGEHGVEVFRAPTPGVRMCTKRYRFIGEG